MRSTPVLCPQWCNFNSECRSSSLHKHTALWVLTLLNQEKKGGGKRGQGHDRKVTNTERGGERECCSGWSGPPTEMSKSWFSEHVTVTVFGEKGVCTCNYVKQFKQLFYHLSGSDGKESACKAGDLGSIAGSGRSPTEGHGNPLQYSCLEISTDRGGWWATVHGLTKSQARLSN